MRKSLGIVWLGLWIMLFTGSVLGIFVFFAVWAAPPDGGLRFWVNVLGRMFDFQSIAGWVVSVLLSLFAWGIGLVAYGLARAGFVLKTWRRVAEADDNPQAGNG